MTSIQRITSVDAGGQLDVVVRHGKRRHAASWTITGDAAARSHVTAEVKDGVLVLRTHGSFHSTTPLRVVIDAADLVSLTLGGQAHATASSTSFAPAIAAVLRGQASLALTGECQRIDLHTDGQSSVDATDLHAAHATLDLTDQSSVKLAKPGSVDDRHVEDQASLNLV
jgi:hypothetical protein